jgi:uncharacterized protein (AIM24 family)
MLSIVLDPGECVIGEAGRFAWMTDSIEMAVAEDEGYRFRRSDFVARTPGVRVRADPAEHGLALWRIGGSGRAWVELAGDVVRRELTAGESLRARPEHVGMFDGTIAVQVTQVHGTHSQNGSYPCAVLSGPGVVWLRSMPAAEGQ